MIFIVLKKAPRTSRLFNTPDCFFFVSYFFTMFSRLQSQRHLMSFLLIICKLYGEMFIMHFYNAASSTFTCTGAAKPGPSADHFCWDDPIPHGRRHQCQAGTDGSPDELIERERERFSVQFLSFINFQHPNPINSVSLCIIHFLCNFLFVFFFIILKNKKKAVLVYFWFWFLLFFAPACFI